MEKIPKKNDWSGIDDFAHSFDGYQWAKSAGKDIGDVANGCQRYFRENGRLPDCSMSELRTSLFFLHRAHRHGGTDVEDYPDEVKYNDALLEAIRDKLEAGNQEPGEGEQYSRENFKELLFYWDNPQTRASQTIRIGPESGRVVENGPDSATFPVSQEQLESLLVCLEKMDFLGLEPVYVSSALDVAAHQIGLEMAGACHWVDYDHGLVNDPRKPDYPAELFELEKLVEEIAGGE